MAQRQKNRLVPVSVARLKEPGLHADGLGLFLRIGPSGSKSWVFRYRNGKKEDGRVIRREMGMGAYPTISLAEAREGAAQARKQRAHNVDPLEVKMERRQAAKIEAAKRMTFEQAARNYIIGNAPGWRSAQHTKEWSTSLEKHIYPALGSLPVAAITTELIVSTLTPIWNRVPETSSRLRGRVEKILDWARVSGYRSGENPARWKGHLDQIFKSRAKLAKGEHLPAKVRHHSALNHAQIAAFMTELRQQEGIAALALQFTILTACRTGETIGATWSEINFVDKVWCIPGQRMKTGREHRVPLAPPVLSLLEQVKSLLAAPANGNYIFPGEEKPKLGDKAMLQLLQRNLGRDDLTVHGFRSSFRDWGAEQTSFQYEVLECALAHNIKSKAQAAYERTDYLDRRRALMESWTLYCGPEHHSELRNVIRMTG